MNADFNAQQYEVIERVLNDTFLQDKSEETKPLHNISPLHLAQFSSILKNAKLTKKKADKAAKDLAKLSTQLESTERNIARAPDEDILSQLKIEFDELISKEVELRTNLELEKKTLKATTLHAINTAQALKKLTSSMNTANDDARLIELCEQSITVVDEFAQILTQRKLKQLESEFHESYQRLARKKDSIPRPVIDPKTFHVSLLNSVDSEIDKNDMSAGEKQVYAIAMLDALAKITGKNLPVIIDTPLGRLDSQHRDNIVENYFPFASHQVIILSTDTEIHQTYKTKLDSAISHSIKLEYSEKTNSTTVTNGYFFAETESRVSV